MEDNTAIIVLLVLLIVGIMAHHWYIHPELDFPQRLFQRDDVRNHESLVLFTTGILIGALFV